MAGELPGGRSGGDPGASQGANAGGLSAGPTGHWFPLLLFGGLAALSLPLSVLFSPRLPAGIAVFTRQVYPTVTQAMYLGGGSSAGPFPFPLGWYWVGLLVTGSLLSAAWYRWRDRRTGSHTPLRGYLATGLALAAATDGIRKPYAVSAPRRSFPCLIIKCSSLYTLNGSSLRLLAATRASQSSEALAAEVVVPAMPGR